MISLVISAQKHEFLFSHKDRHLRCLSCKTALLAHESGGNKGKLTHLIEAICRDFRTHDETEFKTLLTPCLIFHLPPYRAKSSQIANYRALSRTCH
ncbi:MAG: hypothetical protein KBS94_06925 [Prevotella sp.]|nr:hypothetical protein [Candidatus Equicola faecalis]